MKPRINFNIKPIRNGWMYGAQIIFYVVDKYETDRYQTFATMLPLREFCDEQQFEDELYRNSKWVLKRLTELCYMLERWWELAEHLYMQDLTGGVRYYPKPLVYKVESGANGK